MFEIWVVFHVLICIALIVVVLMQSAKGEGLAGSAFGGGGGGLGGAVFGGRGAASFLSNATSVLAVVFMLNCGILAFMSSGTRLTSDPSQPGESSVTRQAQEEYDRMRQQQEQAAADSAAAANQVNPEDLLSAPDTGGGN